MTPGCSWFLSGDFKKCCNRSVVHRAGSVEPWCFTKRWKVWNLFMTWDLLPGFLLLEKSGKNNSLEILFAWNAKIGIAISEKSSKLKPIWLGGHVGFLQGNVIMPGLFIGRSSHVSGDVYITEEKKRGNYWRDHAARCLPLRHGPCLRDRPNHLRTIEPQNQVSWCPQHRVTPTQSIYVTCCYVYYVYSVYETHFWKNILISMFQLMCCMSLSRHVK